MDGKKSSNLDLNANNSKAKAPAPPVLHGFTRYGQQVSVALCGNKFQDRKQQMDPEM